MEKKDRKKKVYMCKWERHSIVFSAAQTLFIVLNLRAQEEKEIENKPPQKVRFLAKGWENVNDVMSDRSFTFWMFLGEGDRG